MIPNGGLTLLLKSHLRFVTEPGAQIVQRQAKFQNSDYEAHNQHVVHEVHSPGFHSTERNPTGNVDFLLDAWLVQFVGPEDRTVLWWKKLGYRFVGSFSVRWTMKKTG